MKDGKSVVTKLLTKAMNKFLDGILLFLNLSTSCRHCGCSKLVVNGLSLRFLIEI